MQDFPDWLYQGHLFGMLLKGDFPPCVSLNDYIAPNIISTLIIGILSTMAPPLIAGKIFLTLLLCLLFYGIYFYIKKSQLNDCQIIASSIAFMLSFNFNFFHGNVNFLFSLSVAFIGGAYILYYKELKGLWLVLINFIGFLSHFFGYCLLGLCLLSRLLYDERYSLKKKTVLFLSSHLIPLALFVHYLLNREYSHSTLAYGGSIINFLFKKLSIFALYFSLFQGLSGCYSPPLLLQYLNWITMSFFMGIIILSFASKAVFYSNANRLLNKNDNIIKRLMLIISALTIVFIILPINCCGIIRPSERLVIFWFVTSLLICLPLLKSLTPRLFKFIKISFLFLTILCYLNLIMMTFKYNDFLAHNIIPQNSYPQQNGFQFHDAFSRLRYYKAIRDKECIGGFSTGLFNFKGR